MKVLFSAFFCTLFLSLSAQPKDSVKVGIKNMGDEVNSPYPDYAPLISADRNVMIFTSRRPLEEKDKMKGRSGLENVYVTYYDDKNKKWLVTIMLGPIINLPDKNNSAIALSNDGQRMLLYRGGNLQSENGDILESYLNGDEWSDPVRLPSPINSDDNESSASISPDGKTIYFVSDRKGGHGGRDIWYCTQGEDGVWGDAVNIGSAINSEEDEEGVFIHPNGNALFFSSKGHNSIGGYDIFVSMYDETSKSWSKAESLGSPINTPGDDIYFVLDASGKTGYYASTRPGGSGDLDIYSATFSDKFLPKNITLLKGHIENKKGIPVGASIVVKNKTTDKVVGSFKSNKSTGKYLVSLPTGQKYELEVSSDGFITSTESLDIPYKTGYGEVIKDIVLEEK